MELTIITPPAVEPVSLAEAKLFLKIDGDAEDALLAGCIAAGRMAVEAYTQRALITRRVVEFHDAWRADASGAFGLSLSPLVAVHAVRRANAAGVLQVMDPSAWRSLASEGLSRIAFDVGHADGVMEVEYSAGYGALGSDAPAALRQAILHACAWLYDNREAMAPPAWRAIAAPFRRVRV